jgi:hypothetical protein
MEPVCAEAHVVLAFANGAILLAGAMFFRLVTHHADDGTGHRSLQGKLYLTMATRGKAHVASMQQVCPYADSECGVDTAVLGVLVTDRISRPTLG